MKSLTKKISVLLLLSVTFFLSSCLDSSSGSWIGNQEFSYIDKDEATGTIYARTEVGYYITSEKIKTLTPGATAELSYQIDFDEAQQTLIGENKNVIIYHATLAGEPNILDQSTLRTIEDAPGVPPVYFESIVNPTYADNEHFGDRWKIPFTIKLKKGETPKVSFYLQSEEFDPTSDEVIIDIRVKIVGEAEEGATEKIAGDIVVANMSELRTMFSGIDSDKLNIKFRFYRSANKDELYTSQQAYPIRIFKDSI